MTAQTPSDVILARMMSLHPKIIDLTLDRMWRLLDRLGNPQDHLPPVIHVAGTNGKGSVQAMLRAGLEATGATVHAYTSPHLVRFHERIRVAGRIIPEPDLTAYLDECERANGGEPITYFEITTVAALLAFARTPADWCLLEVGLGGRLDATNVVAKPATTIITPVSIDHQQYLGETLPEIAAEKAGIIKRGVPCVVGPQQEDALEVIEAEAARLGAPLNVSGQHWRAWEERGRLIVEDEGGLADLPLPNLLGPHQIGNAGTAVTCLRALGLPEAAWEGAVTKAEWPARMQRLRRGPVVEAAPDATIWLDGGHNPAAGEALAGLIATLPPRPTWLVAGMLSTKDQTGFFQPLAGLVKGVRTVPIPGEEAALDPVELAAHAAEAGLAVHPAPGFAAAVLEITAAEPEARVIICGSLYLAGQVLRDHG